MSFYSDPAFFILVAVLAIPAIVLGLAGKSIKVYGFILSLFFLFLLFDASPIPAIAFLGFIVWSLGLTWFTLYLFKNNVKHAIALYRVALALMILPLFLAKAGELFPSSIFGFIGISYITFKAVQVLIEIRDGIIEDLKIFDYLYFVLFFPVFTSGPITRSREFIEEASTPLERGAYIELLSEGAAHFFKGVIYTFLLASFFQWLMWFSPSAIEIGGAGGAALKAIVEDLCYGMYLFFDFAGYSLMAIGLGAALGIRVPQNFRAPFRSIDIKDFWNRWHITLSFWLRDYVFMRMVRAFIKHKTFKSRTTMVCVSFIVEMALMGVWHAFTLDCLVYGVYHGVLLAACEVFQKTKFYKKHKKQNAFKVALWAITMVAVFFGFALFSGQALGGIGGVA